MTSGSRLKKVDLLRSVGGFLSVRAWNLPGSLLLFPRPSMAAGGGGTVSGSIPEDVA
jgi:hypothetical protein